MMGCGVARACRHTDTFAHAAKEHGYGVGARLPFDSLAELDEHQNAEDDGEKVIGRARGVISIDGRLHGAKLGDFQTVSSIGARHVARVTATLGRGRITSWEVQSIGEGREWLNGEREIPIECAGRLKMMMSKLNPAMKGE